jgi:hypothetical protein
MQTYRSNDFTKWGAGKGSDLTEVEVDINFWDIIQRLIDLETNPIAPDEIQSVSLVGDQLTFLMESGGTFGPFTIPVAAFDFTGDFQPTHAYLKNQFFVASGKMYIVENAHTSGATFVPGPNYRFLFNFPRGDWQGEWEPLTPYLAKDFLKVSGIGTFMILTDHTSAATFNPLNATDYAQIGWEPEDVTGIPENLYDIALFHSGAPGVAGAETFYFMAPRAIRLPADGHVAALRTPTSTQTLVFKIQKNDVDIGTITFTPGTNILSSGGQTGVVVVAQTDFAVFDKLSVQDPNVSDATASDLMVTFAAARL